MLNADKVMAALNISEAFAFAGDDCPDLVITGRQMSPDDEKEDDVTLLSIEQLIQRIASYKTTIGKVAKHLKDSGVKIKLLLEKHEQELQRKLELQREAALRSKKTGQRVAVLPKAFSADIEALKGTLHSGSLEARSVQESTPAYASRGQQVRGTSADSRVHICPSSQEGKKKEEKKTLQRKIDKGKDCSAVKFYTSNGSTKERNGVKERNLEHIRELQKGLPFRLQPVLAESQSVKSNLRKQCAGVSDQVHTNGHSFSRKRRHSGPIGTTLDTAMELSDDEEHRVSSDTAIDSARSHQHRYELRSDSKGKRGLSIAYPSADAEAVEVRESDMAHLNNEEFLNDTIIDFYIKYIQRPENMADKERERFHFFNSFFFKKLYLEKKKKKSSEHFSKMRKWTKGINIFEKDYLFVPVHDSAHWSLSIICFGREPDAETLIPYILHLDSMRDGHNSDSIFQVLRSYLIAERDHIRSTGDSLKVDIARCIVKRVEVPLQQNAWDCGLFLLFFIERFVKDAPSEFKASSLNTVFGRQWFRPQEASKLRFILRDILQNLFRDAQAMSLNKNCRDAQVNYEIFLEDMD